MEDLYQQLGSEPTVTFGCVDPPEIVGPLKPSSVQYGVTFRNDRDVGPDMFLSASQSPTVWFNFNKYRPDLPPWHSVVEFVIASTDTMVTFIDVEAVGTDITGDLKTVNVVADEVYEGTEQAAIIEEYEVAKQRDMRGTRDSSFEVTEKLE